MIVSVYASVTFPETWSVWRSIQKEAYTHFIKRVELLLLSPYVPFALLAL